MPKLIKFEDFLYLPSFFYRSVGIDLWAKSGGFLLQFMFYLCVVNTAIVFISEMTFVIISFTRNFVEATMTLSYVGFVIVGSIKMYYMWRKQRELATFLRSMKEIFPRTDEQQKQMNLRRHLRQSTIVMSAFSTNFMILIWVYNLYPWMQRQIYDCWLNVRTIERDLPYKSYIPWDWHDHWSYYLLYLVDTIAGYHTASGQIASDLVICAMGTQIIMHYEHVARRISEYQPKVSLHRRQRNSKLLMSDRSLRNTLQRREVDVEEEAYREDMQFLCEVIAYHSKVLSLSEVMNDVFGVALLVNFMTSSFVICFVGFQMTMDTEMDYKIKLFLFLFSSLVQIYLISHYGQLLIDASVNVAQAVFSHDWPDAHVNYQRMLVLVMARAQQPAMLKATNFVLISRGTMTDIIQISYKFFALIRTMYSD